MNKCLERVNAWHFWNPGVFSYAMIPRCHPNSRVFFVNVTSIVYAQIQDTSSENISIIAYGYFFVPQDPFASRGGTFNVTSKLIPDLLELGKQVTEEKYPFLKEPEPAVEPEEADSPGFPDDAYDQEEMAAHPEYFISDLSEYEQSGDDEGEDAPDDDEDEEPMEEN
jgi:hypothetical protein